MKTNEKDQVWMYGMPGDNTAKIIPIKVDTSRISVGLYARNFICNYCNEVVLKTCIVSGSLFCHHCGKITNIWNEDGTLNSIRYDILTSNPLYSVTGPGMRELLKEENMVPYESKAEEYTIDGQKLIHCDRIWLK